MTVTKAVKSARILVVIIAHGNSIDWLQPAKVVKNEGKTIISDLFFSDLKKMLTLQMNMAMNFDEITERLLETPYWVIDFLPMQVPQDARGQFFAVERYYLEEPRLECLSHQFADVLLKLNCYHDLTVSRGDEWVKNPEPETMVAWLNEAMHQGHLCLLINDGDALVTASSGNTNLTLYNPSPALLELVHQLASAAGLFLWKP